MPKTMRANRARRCGRIGAARTFFTHMTHDIRHADLDRELPEGMALAYDGLVIR